MSKLYQNRVALRWAIFGLIITIAVVHLAVGVQAQAAAETERSLLLILDGMGYFALLTAIALGELKKIQRQIFVYYALGIYTLVSFVLYFVLDGFTGFSMAAMISKCAELLSIIAVGLYIFSPEDHTKKKPQRK
ncbi:MAG: hypothetical protein JXJ17_11685 [Anaerolineae bacterium]|nr:hypothetical protein [Anaerolineae bacterium]